MGCRGRGCRADAAPGKTYCEDCLGRKRAYTKARYYRARATLRCARDGCGNPAGRPGAYCPACRPVKVHASRLAERKARAAARAAGLPRPY
jgi:hypothetical protein